MRVWVGVHETLLPARWFFCAPGALPFPGEHGAEASPWLKDYEVNDDWGEVKGTKILDKGINPGYPGQCNVGDPQWFVDGQLPAELGVWKDPVLTPCCGYVPSANPDARCPQPPPPPSPCSYCKDGSLDTFSIFIEGMSLTGLPLAPDLVFTTELNGAFLLSNAADLGLGCTWFITTTTPYRGDFGEPLSFQFTWRIDWNAPGVLSFEGNIFNSTGGSSWANYVPAALQDPWDCKSAYVFVLDSTHEQDPGVAVISGWPATITIAPVIG